MFFHFSGFSFDPPAHGLREGQQWTAYTEYKCAGFAQGQTRWESQGTKNTSSPWAKMSTKSSKAALTARFLRRLVLAVSCCGFGCGQPKPLVSGSVTYKGNLLASGEVRFIGKKGSTPRSALIHTDGKYQIQDAPLGEVQIAIISMKSAGPPSGPTLGGKKPASSGAVSAPKSAIPTKYNDPKTSGLTFTVSPGTQTFDIELKD